jgi:hypothetical protein
VEEVCHIKEVAEKFYKNLLGSNGTQFDERKEARVSQLVSQLLHKKSADLVASMDREVTDEEIQEYPLFNEGIKSPWL